MAGGDEGDQPPGPFSVSVLSSLWPTPTVGQTKPDERDTCTHAQKQSSSDTSLGVPDPSPAIREMVPRDKAALRRERKEGHDSE